MQAASPEHVRIALRLGLTVEQLIDRLQQMDPKSVVRVGGNHDRSAGAVLSVQQVYGSGPEDASVSDTLQPGTLVVLPPGKTWSTGPR